MKKLITAIFTSLFLLAAGGAYAIPITGGDGETIIINFDLTGATPGPIFDYVGANWDLEDIADTGDEGTITVFGGLDGMGASLIPGSWEFGGWFSGIFNSDADIVDGLFSLAFTSLSGDFTINSAIAWGGVGDATTPIIEGAVSSQVPVPATLALFGLGLAGLGWSRRKKA